MSGQCLRGFVNAVVVGVAPLLFLSQASAEQLLAKNECVVEVLNVAAANGGPSVDELFDTETLQNNIYSKTKIVKFPGVAAANGEGDGVNVPAESVPCDELLGMTGVVSSEPNLLYQATVTPNDSLYSNYLDAHMSNIKAPQAWEMITSAADIKVAIIDTGVDYDHPDLAANMWTNPGEIAGNGIDDDGNGYIDDVHGYDFYNNDGDPDDDNGHGTHCAGTIGGLGNNGIGVAGVAWKVQIMALKFLGGNGGGYLSDAISALNYARENGADVISNSWGGGGFSQSLKNAIDAATEAGALVVAAAGNSGNNSDSKPMYPAAYDGDIVSVAAVDADRNLAYFSNYGATTVDIAAPGVSIASTYKGGAYALLSGTSMATPHVAGAAALVAAATGARGATLRSLLLGNVTAVAGLSGKVVTGGMLNVYAAMTGSPSFSPGSGSNEGSGEAGGNYVNLTVSDKKLSIGEEFSLSVDSNVDSNDTTISFSKKGFSCSLAINSDTLAFTVGSSFRKALIKLRKVKVVATRGGVESNAQKLSAAGSKSRSKKLTLGSAKIQSQIDTLCSITSEAISE